mmetsp:Transcript_19210/g.53556  ORF Transcript_19210/g.53556 Transcript_19210/m.53556 type:complete len:268 (+) Transcript_19210:2350-3153(+)
MCRMSSRRKGRTCWSRSGRSPSRSSSRTSSSPTSSRRTTNRRSCSTVTGVTTRAPGTSTASCTQATLSAPARRRSLLSRRTRTQRNTPRGTALCRSAKPLHWPTCTSHTTPLTRSCTPLTVSLSAGLQAAAALAAPRSHPAQRAAAPAVPAARRAPASAPCATALPTSMTQRKPRPRPTLRLVAWSKAVADRQCGGHGVSRAVMQGCHAAWGVPFDMQGREQGGPMCRSKARLPTHGAPFDCEIRQAGRKGVYPGEGGLALFFLLVY